jgi:hypothetical protein
MILVFHLKIINLLGTLLPPKHVVEFAEIWSFTHKRPSDDDMAPPLSPPFLIKYVD